MGPACGPRPASGVLTVGPYLCLQGCMGHKKWPQEFMPRLAAHKHYIRPKPNPQYQNLNPAMTFNLVIEEYIPNLTRAP